MSRNYTPRAASTYSRLSSDLLVIHGHIECVMLTGKFKAVFNNFTRVTAAFFFLQTGDAMLMTEGVYHCLVTT